MIKKKLTNRLQIAALIPALMLALFAFAEVAITNAASLVITAGEVVTNDLLRTGVTGTNLVGINQLNVVSTNGFATNDWILVIVMQDAEPDMNQNAAGVYEFANISSISSNRFTVSQPLANNYFASGKTIQALRVPIYDSAIVQGTLTCSPWNGTNGGVLVVLCRGDLIVSSNGLVTADGCGYRGGVALDLTSILQPGGQGESTSGYSMSNAPNVFQHLLALKQASRGRQRGQWDNFLNLDTFDATVCRLTPPN